MSEMDFSKYEATENDFIMLDCTSGELHLSAEKVASLCDRHTGVGADGVIVMLLSARADIMMRIFNADGSEAQMCGNGIRALFRFALDRGAAAGDRITVETASGLKTVLRTRGESGEDLFAVEMGAPAWTRPDVGMAGEEEAAKVTMELAEGAVLSATRVSMGNPHCVIFVDDVGDYPVADIGPIVENHALFGERTNVEFVRVVDEERLEVRVWERGVGETMACGTGACASLVAANLNGLTGRKAIVALPGGELEVEWLEEGVRLTGPARHVFDGRTV